MLLYPPSSGPSQESFTKNIHFGDLQELSMACLTEKMQVWLKKKKVMQVNQSFWML